MCQKMSATACQWYGSVKLPSHSMQASDVSNAVLHVLSWSTWVQHEVPCHSAGKIINSSEVLYVYYPGSEASSQGNCMYQKISADTFRDLSMQIVWQRRTCK